MSNKNFDAWYNLREAAEYMLRHDIVTMNGAGSSFYAQQADRHFVKAAQALGYDLVKREAVKVEEAA